MAARSVLFAVALVVAHSAPSLVAAEVRAVLYLGSADVPSGTQFDGTNVGGLSGLAHVGEGAFLAVSDEREAPRAYRLTVDLADGRLDNGDVVLTGVAYFGNVAGARLRRGSVDLEGIAAEPSGLIYAADEGLGTALAPPRVGTFDQGLRGRGWLPTPSKVVPNSRNRSQDSTSGSRSNRGFESLSITPDGRTLVTATEQALIQDGATASPTGTAPVRIITYDLATATPGAEYVYPFDGVRSLEEVLSPPQSHGLVELAALDDEGHFLALERSVTLGGGVSSRLYLVSTGGASDVSDHASLRAQYRPVDKRKLLDLSTLPVPAGNVEGMALGDLLPDGARTLILVSDNNFGSEPTRFHAFALEFGRGADASPVNGPKAQLLVK